MNIPSTIKRIAKAVNSAFERALKAKGLSGEYEIEIYEKEGNPFVDFFFTSADGIQWNPTIPLLKMPRKQKDLEEEIFKTLMKEQT